MRQHERGLSGGQPFFMPDLASLRGSFRGAVKVLEGAT
jgi:hypothetical protein